MQQDTANWNKERDLMNGIISTQKLGLAQSQFLLDTKAQQLAAGVTNDGFKLGVESANKTAGLTTQTPEQRSIGKGRTPTTPQFPGISVPSAAPQMSLDETMRGIVSGDIPLAVGAESWPDEIGALLQQLQGFQTPGVDQNLQQNYLQRMQK